MVRFIILLAVSALLFVAGLGVSWYMMNQESPSQAAASSHWHGREPA